MSKSCSATSHLFRDVSRQRLCGVVFRVFNRANLEVTYAHPLDAVRAGGARSGDRVLIQLTASLL